MLTLRLVKLGLINYIPTEWLKDCYYQYAFHIKQHSFFADAMQEIIYKLGKNDDY